jgi:hypothetical protein
MRVAPELARDRTEECANHKLWRSEKFSSFFKYEMSNHPSSDHCPRDQSTQAPTSLPVVGSSGTRSDAPPPNSENSPKGPASDMALMPVVRDGADGLAVLRAEIKERHQCFCGLYRRTLAEAIGLGDLLQQAKRQMPHGGWAAFLTEAGIGQRAAQGYIVLFKHREEILSKSALNADLTISRAFAALRKSKAKTLLKLENARDVAADDFVKMPKSQGEVPIDSVTLRDGAGTLSESSPLENIVEDGDELDAEMSQEEEEAEKVYLLADGNSMPGCPYDDGHLHYEWVRYQLEKIKLQNDNAPEKRKRNIAAVIVQQQCLVELVRTANRLLETHENAEQPPAAPLMDATGTLRNLLIGLVPGSALCLSDQR